MPKKDFVELVLTREDRENLRKVADKNNRTMVGQVRAWIDENREPKEKIINL